MWVLENITSLKESVEKNEACFGTLDTWLIYKLTGGKLHVTDVSNASCTGFFDPFTMDWAGWAFHIFGVPQKILPRILDTSGDFGSTAVDIFGCSIPIRSCVRQTLLSSSLLYYLLSSECRWYPLPVALSISFVP